MQNLKQRTVIVKEYTEELYKINLRAGYIEDTIEKVARYLNGLRFDVAQNSRLYVKDICSLTEQYMVNMILMDF